MPLRNRVALITGGSKGLGRAMAKALGAAGAKIALVSRKEAELAAAAIELRDAGIDAEWFAADVTDEARVAELEAAVRARFGPVQILINNAGMNNRKLLPDYSLAEWREVMDTNLTSVFLMCRAFIPHMKGTGYGRVINMTSIMGHVSLPMRSAYSASKAGLMGLTKALALEVAADGITVVGISPGFHATEMNTVLVQDPEFNRQLKEKVAVGRWGRIEDIGQLAVFLCSEGASYITGTDIVVDGGYTAL
ncbi:MAG: SDR family NAD(P)-dependent oxidoreductase [Bryobacteraceae bacterium]|nr:SDR family NAD(P)-dependent oxidoreductase [Bryobacteraceae bacterium]